MNTNQLSIDLRPRKFDDIFGQDKIIKELKAVAKSQKWPTAMLLKGSTGTGKSTTAYIIAASINCSSPDTEGNPCGSCPSCKSIIEERFDRDTYCLNANEEGGKDKILELGQLAESAPMYDKKKVIIIEESDGLTANAKSAMLKLLETPRSHVHFILLSMITTGIPKAIADRCQTYSFRSFNTKDIMYALKGMLEKMDLWENGADGKLPKNFKFEGLATIAGSTDGSLREAAQYLQRCLVGKYYTKEDIRDNLGIIGEDLINEALINALDIKGALFFENLGNADVNQFFAMSYANLANAAVYRVTGVCKSGEFYEQKLKEISHKACFRELLSLFEEIFKQSKPYLSKSYFYAKMAEWFSPPQVKSSNTGTLGIMDCATIETRPTRK